VGQRRSTSAHAGVPSSTLFPPSDTLAHNAAAISAGISFTLEPDVSTDGTYRGQFGDHAKDQSGRISLTWLF
jgi:uncharacterized protein with beta-barrel porin domain